MRLHGVRRLTSSGLTRPGTAELAHVDADDRDASGLILSPGWVDLHAHLRDPGFPEKETLQSGSASAAFGGFTHVLAMANTDPVTDRPDRVRMLLARAEGLPIRVSFAGALSVGLDGKVLTDATGLRAAGAAALSDDGRHALQRTTLKAGFIGAAEAGLPVLLHAQKEQPGSGPAAETTAVGEALEVLAEVPQARLHLQHISTGAAVELIRQAKKDGLPVTAEVTPHHLALTAGDAVWMGGQGNVNPPLRSASDRAAVREALADGVIDIVATDHAPHEPAAKAAGANGFHGFETALGVLFGLELDERVLFRACVEKPREIISHAFAAKLEPDDLRSDDWILIDPDVEWTVDPSAFRSRGKNSPFAGRRLRGRVVMTIAAGQVLFERMVQRV
jgi:dihydroorotase